MSAPAMSHGELGHVAAILFDLGGVVCRFLPLRRRALLAAAGHISEQEVADRLAADDFIHQADLGRFTAAGMRAVLRNRLGIGAPDDALDRLWAAAFTADMEVLLLVDALRRRLRTALLTDNPPLLHEALPAVLPEVASRFEPCLFSYQFGVCKPEPAIYRAALGCLELPAQRVLFIDDNPAAVAGARAAGMAAIHFTSAAALRVALAPLLADGEVGTA